MARWRRISVELSSSWPGEPYLRFQPGDDTVGGVIMVEVDADDLAAVARLRTALSPGALGGDVAGIAIEWPRDLTLTSDMIVAGEHAAGDPVLADLRAVPDDAAPLDQALAGLKRIADAAGIFEQTWVAASISEVCDVIADWCGQRRDTDPDPRPPG